MSLEKIINKLILTVLNYIFNCSFPLQKYRIHNFYRQPEYVNIIFPLDFFFSFMSFNIFLNCFLLISSFWWRGGANIKHLIYQLKLDTYQFKEHSIFDLKRKQSEIKLGGHVNDKQDRKTPKPVSLALSLRHEMIAFTKVQYLINYAECIS